MSLADLDRVIELAQGINSASKRALGGDYQMKQTMKAVCHDSGEVLWLLRTMRDNASETTYLRCPKCGQTGWSSVICACDPATAQTERVLAILITPEDV